ncbi:UBX domain-containing protein 4 [Geodia barretti]|uniref:UBX domain-containing protein 4 n=1 Tax=Geodia barretti TaxID=519541 RepID=A0AA35QRR8_GEOBA|nr:UBX domain-containing protein 4 [Geodia barretti]
MEWFSGGVPAAIAASRVNKTLFIVYVYDDSPASSTTTEAWNSSLVRGTMSSNQAVAIKIAKGSLEHQQFSQVYPVFIFPSVFCIGLTGKALAIMNGKQTADELKEKLTEAFQSEAPPTQPEGSGASQPPPPIPPRPSQELSQSPPPLPPRPSSVEGKDSATGGAEAEEGEKLVPPSGGHEGAEGRGQSAAAAWQGSREEKLERAQQTIRQRRREKEEAEIEVNSELINRPRVTSLYNLCDVECVHVYVV